MGIRDWLRRAFSISYHVPRPAAPRDPVVRASIDHSNSVLERHRILAEELGAVEEKLHHRQELRKKP